MQTHEDMSMFQSALDLMDDGRSEEARPLLERLHERDPRDARVNFSLGLVARDAGNDALALAHLKRAASVAKKKAIVFEELARAHIRFEEPKEALEAARRAVALEPKNPDAHVVLGEAYAHAGRALLAEQSYQRALALADDHIGALSGFAGLKSALGAFEEAEALLRRAIASTNGDPSIAFVPISELSRGEHQAADLANLEAAIADDAKRGPKELGRLHFAAGAMADQQDDVARAFDHYEKGHACLYADYDIDAYGAHVEALKRLITPQFLRDRREAAFDSAKPVFVFGMPRSGTTLVERIIDRHSRAAGAGELHHFDQQHQLLGFDRSSPSDFVAAVEALSTRDLKRIGRRYLALLDRLAPGAERVVDKMPQNFEAAWLLALLFPNATFVHCTRDPADTCVSIFSKPLVRGNRYNRSQTTLGRYYRHYHDLMAHWHAVLPVKIRDQSYEAMVADQATESRDLMAHVGLDWEDACLEFYKGERQVMTFSLQQVRQPIYASSIGRWRRYEGQIAPLLAALGDLAPADN